MSRTNADLARELDIDGLVSLFAWGCTFNPVHLEIPTCDEGCPDYSAGCANSCPHDKQERVVREWLEREVEE